MVSKDPARGEFVMGRKPLSVLILTALLYGGYSFLQRYQLEGLDKISVRPRTASNSTGPSGESYASAPARGGYRTPGKF